jgi:hypothetical protein
LLQERPISIVFHGIVQFECTDSSIDNVQQCLAHWPSSQPNQNERLVEVFQSGKLRWKLRYLDVKNCGRHAQGIQVNGRS